MGSVSLCTGKMKVPSIFLLLLLSLTTLVSTAKVKRNPFDAGSGFPSFFAAAKAPFGDSSSSSYNAPAPASAPSYSAPAPSYSAPAPSYPAPSYHQAQPTHNCTIQEETLEAQVCVPALANPKCSPVSLKGVKVGEEEKCVSITRTVCTVGQEEVTEDVCTIEYISEKTNAEATLVEVSFSKECSKQMVTVCQPGYHSPGYGYSKDSYQKCEEVAQETCYNRPGVAPKREQVSVSLPAPRMKCAPQRFSLPTVQCDEVTEQKCVKLPSLESANVDADQCTVGLGQPQCQMVSLSLPVQVCREQLYGEAHKPKSYKQPSYNV